MRLTKHGIQFREAISEKFALDLFFAERVTRGPAGEDPDHRPCLILPANSNDSLL